MEFMIESKTAGFSVKLAPRMRSSDEGFHEAELKPSGFITTFVILPVTAPRSFALAPRPIDQVQQPLLPLWLVERQGAGRSLPTENLTSNPPLKWLALNRTPLAALEVTGDRGQGVRPGLPLGRRFSLIHRHLSPMSLAILICVFEKQRAGVSIAIRQSAAHRG